METTHQRLFYFTEASHYRDYSFSAVEINNKVCVGEYDATIFKSHFICSSCTENHEIRFVIPLFLN